MVLTVWKVKSPKKNKAASVKKENKKAVNPNYNNTSLFKRFIDWLLE